MPFSSIAHTSFREPEMVSSPVKSPVPLISTRPVQSISPDALGSFSIPQMYRLKVALPGLVEPLCLTVLVKGTVKLFTSSQMAVSVRSALSG